MSDGLTYDTLSQAKTMAEDYHNQGYITNILKTFDGKYKVVLSSGIKRLPDEEIETEEISDEDIKWQSEIEKEERKETYRAGKRLPKEVAKRKLEVELEKLKGENAKLERLGMEQGEIVPTRDPETLEVIGYELKRRSLEQRAAETVSKKIPEGIANVPITISKGTESLLEHTSGRAQARGKKTISTTEHKGVPNVNIAWLPEKTSEYIGARKPAIGQIGTADLGKVGMPYLKNVNENKKSIKALPKTKRLNALEDIDKDNS